MKDGVRSSWNWQRPTRLAPVGLSSTPRPFTRSSMGISFLQPLDLVVRYARHSKPPEKGIA
jgi:hypothetical protein